MSGHFANIEPQPIADHPGAPLLERAGGLVRLTLNRPEQHNRLDPLDVDAMTALFAQLTREHASDPSAVRALLITGNGSRTFSSGYTLQAIIEELDSRFERMLDTLEALPFTTFALLNGSVYGGATDLALCCDIRIGTPGLKMFMPAARFGLHYYAGGLRRYVSRLGLAASSKLMLTAMTIESDEMLRIGFLTELVAPDALAAFVGRYLDQVLANEPVVVAQMKRHLQLLAQRQVEDPDLRQLFASMEAACEASLRSPELRRRLSARLSG
jgi:enoyl-CoA hydratase/carnithine racemase